MKLKEKTPHTILNEIIEAAKECGQVMLQADRANFGIKDKAGKANFVTKYDCKIQEMLEKKLSEILPEAEFWGKKRIARLIEMQNIFLWWIRLMELPILLKIII